MMTREEAINNVRSFLGQFTEDCQESIRALVPELAESEDERIIRKITAVLANTPTEIFIRERIKFCECNDWLEKQKEPRYKHEDFFCEKCQTNSFEEGRKAGMKEQKPVEWSKEDEKIRRSILRFLQYHKAGEAFYATTWDKAIGWLESLRPSWKPNEQEKDALRTAISILTEERNFPKAVAQLQNILNTFEGKEPRKDWKPSKAQITALKVVARDFPTDDPDAIDSLLHDLEKLM